VRAIKEQGVQLFKLMRRCLGPGPGILAVVLTSSLAPALAGEIYKTVDAQGHVTYSDHAQSSDSTKTDVRVDQPDPKEIARLSKEQQIQKVEDIERKKQKVLEDQKKAIEDKNKQAQCTAARNQYYSMNDARRIFERDADGNRVFFSDKDAEVKRDEARQAMTNACGG
jgi:hypothetical protein